MFRDELDILECRLTELEDEDVTHVLVEATVDHRGQPKPLAYAENQDRFARWADKIIHVAVDDLDGSGDWGWEEAQREMVRRGLTDAAPDDIIINSDVDEILTPNAIRAAEQVEDGPGWRLLLRHFIYTCDWEIINGEVWDKPAMARYEDIPNFTWLRRMGRPPRAPAEFGPMGWHLSFFGGPAQVVAKVESNCHPDNRDQFKQMAGDGSWERGEFAFYPWTAVPVEPDESWPRWIREGRAPACWFRPRP